MSVSVAMFQPTLKGVSKIPNTGTVVLKIVDSEGGEIDLFFVENSPASITVLGRTPQTPVEQIATFVSKLLHGAEFDSFEQERVTRFHATHSDTMSQVWYDHPTDLDDAGSVLVYPGNTAEVVPTYL
jgi:hypothetical protein